MDIYSIISLSDFVILSKGGRYMKQATKYCGFYQELYNITNDEELIVKLHELYWSDTIKLPKYLYNIEYVSRLVDEQEDIKVRREIAKSHGYPYDTICKKIRENRQEN